ncbi:hypothetical protein CDD80_7490 [Ophiocordyceps camponoti-rufipedis]|uniref:asparagine--tRNA ligase n=1 Tax=Ophiocordyceps camponoti-rufipedis TaxID=2004952 RepID=A0A2C5XDJ0_9HYPO|nr:hypothetical protein CDD80_7490 [Ophiocordyceps camponoti-rufipedis]
MFAPVRSLRAGTWHCAAYRHAHQPRCYSVRVPDSPMRTVAELRAWKPTGEAKNVEVSGWVRSVRKGPDVRFVDITDGSSMRPLQAVVDKAQAGEYGAVKSLRGTFKGAHHNGVEEEENQASASSSDDTHRTTHELHVERVDVLGPSDARTYPIQNKHETPESLRTKTHMRWRTPLNSALLRLRSDAIAGLGRFFYAQGFQQTHPPILTSSDCEGAGQAFSVLPADFFKGPKYLTVSSQLHLEALAQAVGNVWTLAPTFRAEPSDTSRHLSEFYMLEAEMGFVQDMNDVMNLVQSMLRALAEWLRNRPAAMELEANRQDARDPVERLAFEELTSRARLGRRWRGLLSPATWPRITYSEAIERLQPPGDQFKGKAVWGRPLRVEHERWLAEHVGYDEAHDGYLPVFVTHYPRDIKAFYMLSSRSPAEQGPTVECFDLLVQGIGELAGGSMREHRLRELEDSMRRDELKDSIEWYVDLRRWGCPPHGGFGLGFDRLLSYLTGVANVRDVVPFPRHFGRCDC